jgi:iron complex outermembrane recepter protein
MILQGFDLQESRSVIRGIVTDVDGKALPGAAITIVNTDNGVHTNESGAFTFTGLKDGMYKLSFSFIGYETRTVDVELRKEVFLNITLIGKPIETEEVFINATRAGETAPFTYSTIDREMLRKHNTGHDIPFLLSLTPSLVESSEAGNGIGYTSQRIRGTDGSRINVTIDGIPLNDSESQQVFWVDLPDLAASAENIQIQRGVGTSSNGAGAFGATISIQTANPETEPTAEINSSIGSFNTIKNMVSASTGLISDKFALKMRYSDIKSDGYIERTGSDHRSALITGTFMSGKSRIKANVILGEEHTGIGWWGVPEDKLELNRRYNPAGEYTDETGATRYYDNESDNYIQNHYHLIYNLRLNDFLTLNSALHYTKGKGYYEEFREDQSLSNYLLPPVNLGDTVISETDLIRQKWLSNDFYGLVYSLKYNKDRLEAIAGGGMNKYVGDHFGNIIWMKHAGNVEKDYQWYLNSSVKSEVSVYGKVNYALSDLISVFGDLQYRHIQYTMKGVDDDQRDLEQTHRFGFFNPKTGLFFKINPYQNAYFSFSVANREPSRADFKEAVGDPDATPKPETLYDFEMGYKLNSEKSAFGINLYGMFYKDQLVPTGELSDVGYPISTNVEKSYRTGIELTAGFKPVEFLDWNFNLTLSRNKILDFTEYFTDYNTTDWSSQYSSKNLGEVDIAYSPAIISSSDIALRISPQLNLHLISKYVGKQYFDNTASTERMIDPYFINNIRLDYEPVINFVKGVELQFLINNIFNEKYESNAYGGNWYEDGIENTWAYYFPQAGTNFMFRLGLRF